MDVDNPARVAFEAALRVVDAVDGLILAGTVNGNHTPAPEHVRDAYSRLADAQHRYAEAMTSEVSESYRAANQTAATVSRITNDSFHEIAGQLGAKCLNAVLAAVDFNAWSERFHSEPPRPRRVALSINKISASAGKIPASLENHQLTLFDTTQLRFQLSKEFERAGVSLKSRLNDNELSIIEAVQRLWTRGLEWPGVEDIAKEAGIQYQQAKSYIGPMYRHHILDKGPSDRGFKVRT